MARLMYILLALTAVGALWTCCCGADVHHPSYDQTMVCHTHTCYRYALTVAEETSVSNRCMCPLMSVSSPHPNLHVQQMSPQMSECVAARCAPTQHAYNTDEIIMPRNGTGNVTKVGPCAETHPLSALIVTSGQVAKVGDMQAGTQFPYCFVGNGSLEVGELPPYHCRLSVLPSAACLNITHITWTDTLANGTNVTTKGLACATKAGGMACPRNHSCTHWSSDTLPSPGGTPALAGVHWLCGHQLYVALPPGWGGVCAPVTVTAHT